MGVFNKSKDSGLYVVRDGHILVWVTCWWPFPTLPLWLLSPWFFYWLWNNPVFEHAISLLIPKDHSHVEVSGLRTSYPTFPLCKALHMFFVRSKIDHRTLDIIIQLGNRTSKFIPFNGSFIWQLFTSQSMVESCSNGNSLMILK